MCINNFAANLVKNIIKNFHLAFKTFLIYYP